MLVPDGPAVAYTLAQQPDLVQRLNGLPPPLVLVELGRLAPPPQPTTATPAVGLDERHHAARRSRATARADGAGGGRGKYGAADVLVTACPRRVRAVARHERRNCRI